MKSVLTHEDVCLMSSSLLLSLAHCYVTLRTHCAQVVPTIRPEIADKWRQLTVD